MYDLKKLVKQVKQPNRPNNTFTTFEYAKEVGVGVDVARNHMRELLAQGKIKPTKIKFTNITGTDQLIPAWEVVN